MLKSLMQYSGTAAKVRAMYGRRLRPGDFERLYTMTTPVEILSFLRESPGWGPALGDYVPPDAECSGLETALGAAVTDEFVRIYKFMSHEDHPLLRGMIDRSEQTEILNFILLWKAGTPTEYRCSMPEYFAAHSPVDYSLFRGLINFEQFWSVISKSSYYTALAKLPRERGEAPDYTIAKTVMDTQYYSNVFKIIDKKYSGDTALKLGEGFGAEVDLLNILSIVRVKNFFSSMADGIADYLIPLRHRIRPALLKAMTDAPDGETVVELVKASPYRKLFCGFSFSIIDDYLTQHLYDFNRKILAAPSPSVYIPLAYLNLKEIELSNIRKIIECVRYGTTPREAGIHLTGLDVEGANRMLSHFSGESGSVVSQRRPKRGSE